MGSFSIQGHWNYSLNNQCPCLFPLLLSTIPIFPRTSSLPGAEADTYCRILRLVIWGRERASASAVLSPKPFLDSLGEAEMECYWQWSPEPHSSPVCYPQGCVTPIPHPHVPGAVLKGPNVPDSRDPEGGRKKQWGFEILQQKLNREVQLSCTSQKHTYHPSWVTWAGIELKFHFFMCP